MKKIVSAIFIIISIVFIVGCGGRGEPELAIVSTSTVTKTSTSVPTQTATPQPTPTATTDPCFQEVDFAEMSAELSGYLVLKDISYDTEEYYLDWESGEHIPFQTQRAHPYQMSLSPDGQWLAYYADKDVLVVERMFGDIQYELNMDSISREWNSLFGWINNETLLVKFYGADQSEMDYLMVINPFTGQIKKLISENYPNILTSWWQWRRTNFWRSLVFYDTTMQYVVYPANPDDDIETNHLVFYDTLQEKVIGKSGFLDSTLVTPIWKEDGSGFYYVASGSEPGSDIEKDDWYFMNISGEMIQLTHYQEIYESAEIHAVELSPNEKFLFYGIFAKDDKGVNHSQIQILDLETLEITDTGQLIDTFATVVWSPDSRFISYSEDLAVASSRIWIMDMGQHTVSVLTKNVQPVLWGEEDNETLANRTPTPTPFPTKSVAEKEAFIREMYETNGGCDLPCFWGIEPGQQIEPILNQFQPYSTISEKDLKGAKYGVLIDLIPPEEINFYHHEKWNIQIRYEENKIKTVSGYANLLGLFRDQDMNVLLRDLGQPDEIWITVNPESQREPFYEIYLFYSQKGAFVSWYGELDSVEFTKNSYTAGICPVDFANYQNMDLYYGPPLLFFWSPEEQLTYQELFDTYFHVDLYQSLLSSQNSTANLEAFHELYIQDGQCFTYFDEW